MQDELIEATYDITKKSKLRRFYESNKILIISIIAILFFVVGALSYYFDSKNKKNIYLSDQYIEAKIHLENQNKEDAIKILKNIILEEKGTYPILSLFLILNENLISNRKELLDLFDYVLENNKIDEEHKNLILFKKLLFGSNFVNEAEVLELANPLLNSDSLWKPHSILLLGDYFFYKKEFIKSKEFYAKILLIKGLSNDLYNHAKSQLLLIEND